jgi:hypothetical protein
MLTKPKGAALGTRRPSDFGSVAGNRSGNNHGLIEGARGVFKASKAAAGAIAAELIGSNTIVCAGQTTISPTPILDLCRELIAEGFDAKASLVAYRDGKLAITIRSIGEAAELRIRGNGLGFEKLSCPTAPPIRKNENRVPEYPRRAGPTGGARLQ